MSGLENRFTDFFPLNTPTWFDADKGVLPISQTVPTVLIESQHYDTRLLLTFLLKLWDFEVVESANFDDTLTLIETERPEVILFDCLKPFEQSLERVNYLKNYKLTNKIPLIALSNFAGTHYIKEMLDAGADEYLLKPLNLSNLETIIRENIKNNQRKYQKMGDLL